jgi:hypothetical protein
MKSTVMRTVRFDAVMTVNGRIETHDFDTNAEALSFALKHLKRNRRQVGDIRANCYAMFSGVVDQGETCVMFFSGENY